MAQDEWLLTTSLPQVHLLTAKHAYRRFEFVLLADLITLILKRNAF